MVTKLKKYGQQAGTRMRHRLMALIVIYFISRKAVYGRLDVNVALNRPAYQISAHYEAGYGGYYVASRGVDGNSDPVATKMDNSCVHTSWETNPWWGVDLGLPLAVAGVLFTNRDGWGYRSNNFIIGLTDVSPNVTAPTLWNYDVCGQWPGVVGEGATVYLACQDGLPYRRYLLVQTQAVNEILNFCELQVYIRRWNWHGLSGQMMTNKVASSFQVKRHSTCTNSCMMSSVCDSYNYRAADKTCQLNTHDTPLIANSTDIVADNDWSWWSTDFITVA